MAIPDVSEKSIAELISLKGRNAVVTGGARGIGLAICKRLAEAVANIAHYVASKHGVRGLTKSLAIELGPHNIRVLALAPTLISTPGISESGLGLDTSAYESQPLGRVGVPDDVGRVALFCASDLSMLMTGSTIAVDAGALTA